MHPAWQELVEGPPASTSATQEALKVYVGGGSIGEAFQKFMYVSSGKDRESRKEGVYMSYMSGKHELAEDT